MHGLFPLLLPYHLDDNQPRRAKSTPAGAPLPSQVHNGDTCLNRMSCGRSYTAILSGVSCAISLRRRECLDFGRPHLTNPVGHIGCILPLVRAGSSFEQEGSPFSAAGAVNARMVPIPTHHRRNTTPEGKRGQDHWDGCGSGLLGSSPYNHQAFVGIFRFRVLNNSVSGDHAENPWPSCPMEAWSGVLYYLASVTWPASLLSQEFAVSKAAEPPLYARL